MLHRYKMRDCTQSVHTSKYVKLSYVSFTLTTAPSLGGIELHSRGAEEHFQKSERFSDEF